MRPPTLEAGLLPAFRVFAVSQILFVLLVAGLERARPDPLVRRNPLAGILVSCLLLAYLSWPWLRERLGSIYLPVALIFASLTPLLGYAHLVRLRLDAGVPAAALLRDSWILIVFLLVPVILTAWQYRFRAVLGLLALTALFDVMLFLPLAARGGPAPPTFVGVALARALILLPAGYVVARLMGAERSQREALAEANRRLAGQARTLEQLAVSRERNRLARELHDTLAHTLSALAVQLEAMSAIWESRPDTARAMLREALLGTRRGLADARRAIQQLRAEPLAELGLAGALRELAEAEAARAGLLLELHLPEGGLDLGPDAEHAVYRVAAEAVANVARHAEARHLEVRLQQAPEGWSLLIADDGRGFDPQAEADDRYGLRGMRERAELAGASLDVRSGLGQGTSVRFAVKASP